MRAQVMGQHTWRAWKKSDGLKCCIHANSIGERSINVNIYAGLWVEFSANYHHQCCLGSNMSLLLVKCSIQFDVGLGKIKIGLRAPSRCPRTRTHTYTHTHKFTHAHIHKHTQTHMHTHTTTQTHAFSHARSLSLSLSLSLTHTHTHTHTHTRTQTCTQTHPHKHKNTQTHTHKIFDGQQIVDSATVESAFDWRVRSKGIIWTSQLHYQGFYQWVS